MISLYVEWISWLWKKLISKKKTKVLYNLEAFFSVFCTFITYSLTIGRIPHCWRSRKPQLKVFRGAKYGFTASIAFSRNFQLVNFCMFSLFVDLFITAYTMNIDRSQCPFIQAYVIINLLDVFNAIYCLSFEFNCF